jgi:hypothetical protein
VISLSKLPSISWLLSTYEVTSASVPTIHHIRLSKVLREKIREKAVTEPTATKYGGGREEAQVRDPLEVMIFFETRALGEKSLKYSDKVLRRSYIARRWKTVLRQRDLVT